MHISDTKWQICVAEISTDSDPVCQGFVLVQSQFLVSWWETASAAVDEKKTLHLHYSILTSRLISAQGHQYFWHFSGGINIEWMSLCCARGATCLGASTKITWICLLACSVSRRDCRLVPPESAFNIMHHKQYPIWTIELWKYTVWAGEGDDKKSTSCVSDE